MFGTQMNRPQPFGCLGAVVSWTRIARGCPWRSGSAGDTPKSRSKRRTPMGRVDERRSAVWSGCGRSQIESRPWSFVHDLADNGCHRTTKDRRLTSIFCNTSALNLPRKGGEMANRVSASWLMQSQRNPREGRRVLMATQRMDSASITEDKVDLIRVPWAHRSTSPHSHRRAGFHRKR